ncbi:Golgi SNAP receptor complex member 1 [Apophysomyces sp. BC1015]|nr:Golgi SNAP receptor complex member 1 [Apophysomyces sp. BC1015]KAG0181517.1 Golgi SNAP receptor complex member 1 [Apophysomyces sp. BC1021]
MPLLRDDEADLSTPAYPPLSWDQLRREARQLENEIDLKLAALSKISPSNDKPGQEQEIDDLLKKVIDNMKEFLDRPSATPTSVSMIHLRERHENILYDYTKEFKRLKSNIKAARDKASLMDQVKDEIRIFNAGNGDDADYYLTERNRVESSHRMTDMIIE